MLFTSQTGVGEGQQIASVVAGTGRAQVQPQGRAPLSTPRLHKESLVVLRCSGR